jgi:2-isopropylmalate synthase
VKEGPSIYDWNKIDQGIYKKPSFKIEFDDETLRDGLQSPSVTNPTIQQKIEILKLMDDLGLDTADIGMPVTSKEVKRDVYELARFIAENKLRITPNCAARTLNIDVEPIVEISQKVGIPVEACLFIGSSPIRQYVEGWTLPQMLKTVKESIKFAVSKGLPVMSVTEDTTRAKPDDLEMIYLTAIDAGATRICLADTVGHTTPTGTFQLVSFIKRMLEKRKITHVKIDWHGHNDRGLAVWNTITATAAGAHRVHGTALGIGERCGNASMDQILVNYTLLGWIDNDLTKLSEYCQKVSQFAKVPIVHNYPVMGYDAFTTGTGVHAAAIIKAIRKGEKWFADIVYSAVPACWFGRTQNIMIGPMSGKSNIIFWLEQRGKEAREELVDYIFEKAKKSNRLLTEEEVEQLIKQFSKQT